MWWCLRCSVGWDAVGREACWMCHSEEYVIGYGAYISLQKERVYELDRLEKTWFK